MRQRVAHGLAFLLLPAVLQAQEAAPAGSIATAPPPGAVPARPAASAAAPARRPASAAQAPPPQRGASAAAPASLGTVQVNARRDDNEQRRQSTAAKIVVGREEIEQFGDTSLSDVLKRLPSVTMGGRPGRGGRIAMRGMGGGYTQILIDGERIPPGFSVDDIPPEQVERIEIYRAPTAETGARAIAGTINIILREPLRLKGDDVRLAVSRDRTSVQPHASWSRNDALGAGGNYTLNLSVSGNDRKSDTVSHLRYSSAATGADEMVQDRFATQDEHRRHASLGGRFQWQIEGGQFTLQPFVVMSRQRSRTDTSVDQILGRVPSPYATSAADNANESAYGRVMFDLRRRFSETTRAELRGWVGAYQYDGSSLISQFSAAGVPVLSQSSQTRIRDRSWNLSGKLSHLYADKHSLVAGLEAEGARRRENSLTLLNGAAAIEDFDGDVQAGTRRIAGYVQDEWEPTREWSAHAGLRWETIETTSSALGAPVSNRSTVITPLAHAVWRFNAPARDQVRISLTRSYKPPTLQNLVALPVISTQYPAPGANTGAAPDRAGNPSLRPEVARGLDIALEHYLPKGGVVSVALFRRDIEDLIRSVTALETVPWATAQRWVTRPQNLGPATSQGIEFDAKLRLDELIDDARPVALRANASVFRSSVRDVPGPDNRIDEQPRATANVGADYRLRGVPLMIGGSLNWTPAYDTQLTGLQRQSVGMNRVIDAFALWSFSPTTRLRVSVANLVPRHYLNASSILADGQVQARTSDGPTYRVVSVRLEMKI